MSEIEWAEPKRNPGRYDWDSFAAALRARPGEWARISVSSASYVQQIKTGRLRSFRPAGEFEAQSTVADDGPGLYIYARFVGEGGAA